MEFKHVLEKRKSHISSNSWAFLEYGVQFSQVPTTRMIRYCVGVVHEGSRAYTTMYKYHVMSCPAHE